ncbi:Reverse transcriptase (RNA-dependent DNA polymerase) [Popillia japonica]|uniref:Reverse transcriptase (RNA-dependent DNA polymerase) n=1 Tax=Popillia japonica TaxID=7064 RepID=A0AAW1MVW9_POPJA
MPPRRDHEATDNSFSQHPAATNHFRHQSGQATPPPTGPRPAADSPSPPPGVQPRLRGRRNHHHHLHHEAHHLAEGRDARTSITVPLQPGQKTDHSSQVAEILVAGVIGPSHSKYSSPVVIVNKKDGKPRFCVDYGRLNDRTRSETSPLPTIQEPLRDLGKARIFNTLDLRSGYWQIQTDASSKQYTAFTTPDGATYEFNVMPSGLKNAPITFQKLMARDVLVGYFRDFAIAYLDPELARTPPTLPPGVGTTSAARTPPQHKVPLR